MDLLKGFGFSQVRVVCLNSGIDSALCEEYFRKEKHDDETFLESNPASGLVN